MTLSTPKTLLNDRIVFLLAAAPKPTSGGAGGNKAPVKAGSIAGCGGTLDCIRIDNRYYTKKETEINA